mmetsp:Transcript_7919/g.29617  ORF Transcript_7919/g.29617 Transcript_7919/m.29617 type:complete len:249 (+) Transcript_7919:2580-3326(+)
MNRRDLKWRWQIFHAHMPPGNRGLKLNAALSTGALVREDGRSAGRVLLVLLRRVLEARRVLGNLPGEEACVSVTGLAGRVAEGGHVEAPGHALLPQPLPRRFLRVGQLLHGEVVRVPALLAVQPEPRGRFLLLADGVLGSKADVERQREAHGRETGLGAHERLVRGDEVLFLRRHGRCFADSLQSLRLLRSAARTQDDPDDLRGPVDHLPLVCEGEDQNSVERSIQLQTEGPTGVRSGVGGHPQTQDI